MLNGVKYIGPGGIPGKTYPQGGYMACLEPRQTCCFMIFLFSQDLNRQDEND